jgi:hypothetical protein
MQSLADEQDTAFSEVEVPLGAAAVAWIVQVEPFQAMARSCSEVPSSTYPTAMHARADAHDTPFSVCDGGLPLHPWPMTMLHGETGRDWPLQLAPFQRSANGVPPA